MAQCCISTTSEVSAGDKLRFYVSNYGDWRDGTLTVLVNFLAAAFTYLSVSSYIKVAPVLVANLPDGATAGAGARAMVSDATVTTFASTVAGGGANVVPVFWNGTNWKIG